jgi:hypothetical protein
LHCRMRKGSANTQRGTKRFVQELIPRCRRAGANGKITIRFDSGYQSEATLKGTRTTRSVLHHGGSCQCQGDNVAGRGH